MLLLKSKNLNLLMHLINGMILNMKHYIFIMFMETDKFKKEEWQLLYVFLKIN